MSFKSKSQRGYLFVHEPEVAKEFAEHTSKTAEKQLPKYVSKDKNRLKEYSKKHRRSNA